MPLWTSILRENNLQSRRSQLSFHVKTLPIFSTLRSRDFAKKKRKKIIFVFATLLSQFVARRKAKLERCPFKNWQTLLNDRANRFILGCNCCKFEQNFFHSSRGPASLFLYEQAAASVFDLLLRSHVNMTPRLKPNISGFFRSTLAPLRE